jgi:hypothetical protein
MTTLYSHENEGGRTAVTLELLPDGSLQLFYYDIGEDSRRAFGDSDYEAWTTVPACELPKLALALLAEKYAGRHDARENGDSIYFPSRWRRSGKYILSLFLEPCFWSQSGSACRNLTARLGRNPVGGQADDHALQP